jgi:DNA-binding winged helix-turn-helix (wHTH) protein
METREQFARRRPIVGAEQAGQVFELNFPNAVRDDRDFFDRTVERVQIQHAFRSSTSRPIVILGERRIGKTSLLNISTNWLNTQTQYRVVFPGPWNSLGQFKLEFLSALASAVGERLRQKEWLDSIGQLQLATMTEFVEACREICAAARGRQFVICIDEFDSFLLSCTDTVERGEIQALAFYLVEQSRLPITLFFTMTQPTEKIGRAYPTSFLNKSEQIHLRPFSRIDTDSMVTRLLGNEFSFSEDSLDHLYQLCGGHPYFVKALLDSLVNPPLAVSPGTEVDRACIDRAVKQAIERSEVYYTLTNLLETHFADDERRLLAHLARVNDPTPLAHLSDEWQIAARALAKRDYVVIQPDEKIALRLGFLHYWLNAQVPLGLQPAPLATDQASLSSGVLIDEDSQRVYANEQEIRLTALELRLILYLGRHLDRVVNRDELAESVWGMYDEGIDNARIDQAIARIRKKLGDDSKQQKYIETRTGMGYLLRNVRFIPRRS